MKAMLVYGQAQAPAELTPSQELCAAAGLTERLPDLLLSDPSGRPFEPARLGVGDDATALPEQLAFLMRHDPVLGAEPQIRAGAERILGDARARLRQRLLAGDVAQSGALLEPLRDQVRRVRDALSHQAREVEQEYARVQEDLRAWQKASTRQRGLMGNLVGWVFGGPTTISLPQAFALWEQRERLGAHRAALAAAVALLSRFTEELGTMLDQREALLDAARRGATSATRQLETLGRADEGYGPWSWRVDTGQLLACLARRADQERLLGELVALAFGDGPDSVAGHAEVLARAEARRLLDGLDLEQSIELEAEGAPLDGADPLVLVGRRLLEQVARDGSWRLVRGARRRVETVQVTGTGEPLFHLDGLSAAIYGDGIDRLGFVQVELGVASDELQLLREGADAFAEALRLRNLYIVEALAERAASTGGLPAHITPAAPTDAAAQPAAWLTVIDGRHEQPS